MTVSNIHEVKQWFEVMQTTERSQTAVMILDAEGQSSEELNRHEGSDQVLLVIQGELDAEVGGEKKHMRQGDVCIVPAGTPHRFKNSGKSRSVTFNVYSPPEYSPREKG
jgi:mannose-6-phosphate isomerase-like protein (cupin superfamily)